MSSPPVETMQASVWLAQGSLLAMALVPIFVGAFIRGDLSSMFSYTDYTEEEEEVDVDQWINEEVESMGG